MVNITSLFLVKTSLERIIFLQFYAWSVNNRIELFAISSIVHVRSTPLRKESRRQRSYLIDYAKDLAINVIAGKNGEQCKPSK